jgi:YNFM family putative membrane transporter
VAGALAMATFVGLYNAVPFRLDGPPFSLGAAEVFVYFAYPLGILAPGLFHRISRRLGRAMTSLPARSRCSPRSAWCSGRTSSRCSPVSGC